MDSVNASGADDNNTKIDTAAGIITATSSDTASGTETNKAPHLRIDTNIAYIDIDSENATTDVDEVSIVSSKISDRLTSDNILTEKRTPKAKRHDDDEEYEPIAGSVNYQNDLNNNNEDRSNNKKLKLSKRDMAFDDQRSGKWTVDEENFANQLVKDFEKGFLDDCEEGITLRCYLARRLNCAPMRISKKFSGRCIGKLSYVKCEASYESEKLKSPLSRLEEIYIQSYNDKKSNKSRRNSRNRVGSHSNGDKGYQNADYTYSDDNYDYNDNDNESTSDDYEESINSSETDNSNKNHYRYESSSGSSVDPLTQIAGVGFDANFDPFLDYGFDNDNEANEWKAVLLSLNNSAVAKINNLRPTVIKPDGSDVTERINRSRSSDNIQEQGLQRSRSSASLLI